MSMRCLSPRGRAVGVRSFVPPLWPDSVRGHSTGSQDKVRARKSEGHAVSLIQTQLLHTEIIGFARSTPCPNPLTLLSTGRMDDPLAPGFFGGFGEQLLGTAL